MSPQNLPAHVLRLLILALLVSVALSACSGSTGETTPPATNTTETLVHLRTSNGSVPLRDGRFSLAPSAEAVELLLLRTDSSGVLADLTPGATWSIDDPSVATLVENRLAPLAAGQATVTAAGSGLTRTVQLTVLEDDAAEIVGLSMTSPALVRADLGSSLELGVLGLLENGSHVPVDGRVAWTSADPDVATVDATGTVQTLTTGLVEIRAATLGAALEARTTVHVTEGLPSGSVVVAADGGRVDGPGASVYLPPGALADDAAVFVERVPENDLPAALPASATLLGAVRVDLTPATEVGSLLAELSGLTLNQGGPARVLGFDGVGWRDAATGAATSDGSARFRGVGTGLFAVTRDAQHALGLAERFAPDLVVDSRDIYPIRFDDLLAGCDLFRKLPLLPDPMVESDVTPETLEQFDDGAHYLRLDPTHRELFEQGSPLSWSSSALGGMSQLNVPGMPQPAVYYAVLGDEDQLPSNQVYGSLTVIQYWMLSAMSGSPFRHVTTGFQPFHEGDLEMVQVVLELVEGEYRPRAVTASQHFFGESRHWRDVERQGDHPRVQIAMGGHASFLRQGFEPGTRDFVAYGSVGSSLQGTGPDGFLAKVATIPLAIDETPFAPVTLSRDTPTSSYTLIDLASETPETRMLLGWRGRIDLANGVPMIRFRGPGYGAGLPALSIYSSPVVFHDAYDFSTRVSILSLIQAIGLDTSQDQRIALGRRMLVLQDHYAEAYLDPCTDEPTTGPVQDALDERCTDTVERMADYLANRNELGLPEEFLACPPEPSVAVVAPPQSSSFQVGSNVIFRSEANEPECRDLDLVWTSNRDGMLGVGPVVARDDLSLGTHQVTVTATIAGGAEQASDTVTVTITQPGGGGDLECDSGVTLRVTEVQGGAALRVEWCTGNDVIQQGGAFWTLQVRVGGVCTWQNLFTAQERNFEDVLGNGLGSSYCLRVIVQQDSPQGGGCETGIIASDTDGTDC